MEVKIGDDQGGVVLAFVPGGDISVKPDRKGGLISIREARLMADTLYLMADHLEASNNGH